MKVFIFIFLTTTVNCLRLQLFESSNYHDLYKEFELSSEQGKTCVTTKDSVKIKSIKTDKCIIIYENGHCLSPGHTRVDNDIQSDQIPFRSFHVCSQELGGGPLLDVDFQSHKNVPINHLEYRNVCGCKNIPTSFAKLTDDAHMSFHNHGNGLAVFEKDNCEPPYYYFRPGEFDLVKKYPHSVIKMRSFSPMRTTNCVRLNASVTRFEFTSESTDKLIEAENVTSSLESVFRNNGTAKISQDYTVAQRYKETLEFSKSTGWSNVHTVGVSGSVESKSKAEIPFVGSAEVTMKLGLSYQWQNTQSGGETERRSVENEETTTIRQAIEIPPCTEYHVNSYVQMAKNYSVDYTATARLTGKAGDDNMRANELKNNVGAGMEFVRELDEFAIEVKVKGQMFARYGIKTFIVGEGHPIEGCLQNIPKSNKRKSPKHFEIELPLKKE